MPASMNAIEKHQYAVYEALMNSDQPLVAQEVAALTDIEITSARKTLSFLVDQGNAFFRKESADERSLRYGGGTAKAASAKLFSCSNPVPPRTRRVATDAYIAQKSDRTRHTSSKTIDSKVASVFKRKPLSYEFTTSELAATAGVHMQTLSHRVRSWRDKGMIVPTNGQTRFVRYRVADHAALLRNLGVDPAQVEIPVTKPRPAKMTRVDPTPTKNDEVLEVPSHELEELFELLGRYKARIAELEAQVPTTRSVTSISDRLDAYR